MWITIQKKQIFVALLCIVQASQQIVAVINNPTTEKTLSKNSEQNITTQSNATEVADSLTAETELEANRREAPVSTVVLADNFGPPPITSGGASSYIPTAPSNPNLPLPVYGVPSAPSNNIIYPEPPPDIPPPVSLPLNGYEVPKPINIFGSPSSLGPPPLPSKAYGPPSNKYNSAFIQQIPPKNFIPPLINPKPSKNYGSIRPSNNRIKPFFVPKLPKPNYGPPKAQYGAPKLQYGAPLSKPSFSSLRNRFKQTQVIISPPSKLVLGKPSPHYGPLEPVPHGPPHPGAPAPPTPPDIKYDGWQPIPGLVSRPPSTYGIPEGSHNTGDLHFNSDFTPPPIENHGLTLSSHSSYSSNHGVSDSYGAPLNSVTGSGGIVGSSGDAYHDDHSLSLGLSAAGITASDPNQLKVIKSIGYELFPNSGRGGNTFSISSDSYSVPPLNSYAPTGPYAAAHSYNANGLSSSPVTSLGAITSHNSLSLSSSGVGLIPPSGVYGVPSSGQYGTPLLNQPSSSYGAPLNALKINPPKQPVIFREPVPVGLIESIGKHTAQKDAHGINENSFSNNGPAYIPPPIPDLSNTYQKKPPPPSSLYSLPNPNQAVSFQNVGHDSLSGLNSPELNFGGAQIAALTSYTAPLGAIDDSYNLPLSSDNSYSISFDNINTGGDVVNIDHSHPPLTIDLTKRNLGDSVFNYNYQNNGNDCQKSQSSFTYGVPSINNPATSLLSVSSNVGNSLSTTYGISDLHSAHSQPIASGLRVNTIDSNESSEKEYGKSLTQNLGLNGEVIKSEALDINNIPISGSLGTYTLQIQSANEPNGVPQIPHAQVLNDGLLQSILAAIEQPQQDQTILGQPVLQLQPISSDKVSQSEVIGEDTITKTIVVPAPLNNSIISTANDNNGEAIKEPSFSLIDNNEIALYFNSNAQNKEESDKLNVTSSSDKVQNAQQYGSYVSFKTSNGGHIYKDLSHQNTEKIIIASTSDAN